MSAFFDLSLRRFGPSRGSHSHDYFQILWGLEGSLDLEVDGEGVLVAQGSGFVIAPGERHDFESSQGRQCLVFETASPAWSACHRVPECSPAVDHLARSLALALSHEVCFDSEHGAELLGQLWGVAKSPPRLRRDIDWDKLTRWVRLRLSAPLSVADLAQQVSLSESQFRARCVEDKGIPPMEWLRRLRAQRAIELRATGMCASQAAEMVGYGSSAALATALRRRWNKG